MHKQDAHNAEVWLQNQAAMGVGKWIANRADILKSIFFHLFIFRSCGSIECRSFQSKRQYQEHKSYRC